jgi:hypothetical protein
MSKVPRPKRAKDSLRLRGDLTVSILDAATGQILSRETVKNLSVLTGRNLIRDFLYGDAVTGLTHFAVGTGAVAPVAGNATLGAEVFRDTITALTKADGKLTVTYYLASGSANGHTLTEAGIFTAAIAGTMYSRAVYTGIPKTSSIAITYSWDLTFTPG